MIAQTNRLAVETVGLGIIGLASVPLMWELAVRMGWLDPAFVSSPGRVAGSLGAQLAAGDLERDLGVTLTELGIGLAVSVVLGISIGGSMGLQRSVESVLSPFIWFLYAAPIVAFYPLLVNWLGFGTLTVIAIVVVLTVTPIAVNVVVGVQGTDRVLIRAVRSLGGTAASVVTKVVVPASLPMVLAGLRIGVGRALIGVILGELFSANAGLGYRLAYYGARLRATEVLVQILVVVMIGVILTQGIRLVEGKVSRWRRE